MEDSKPIHHSQEPLSLREEFRCQRFGLNHDSPTDFLRSQWQSTPKSRCFLVYRWLLGAFFGTVSVSYAVIYFQRGHTLLYLTNWGFYMCAITSVTGAVLQTVYHFQKEPQAPRSCLIKSYWCFYWTTLCVAHVVSIAYWCFIYPADRVPTNPTYVSDFFNICTHAVPVIAFTVDNCVVAQPARLMHFIYPIGFCLVYTGVTLIFYFAGGHDLNGRRYLYRFLNYSDPKNTAITVTAVLVVLAACSTLQYGVYRLRTFVARKCGKLLL